MRWLCCAHEEGGSTCNPVNQHPLSFLAVEDLESLQVIRVKDPIKKVESARETSKEFEQCESTSEDDNPHKGKKGVDNMERPSRQFTVSIYRSRDSKIGMQVDHGEGVNPQTLRVSNLKDGLIQTWNSEHHGLNVEVGDLIVAVNGKNGSSKDLLDEIFSETTVSLLFEKAEQELWV